MVFFAHTHSMFALDISIFNFQFSIFGHFNFQYSNMLVFKFSNSFHTFHKEISIFNFQLSIFTHPNSNISVCKISNSRRFTYKFQISIFNFQCSHDGIQTFQFSNFYILNIPYTIIVPWQVWHMPPKQLN